MLRLFALRIADAPLRKDARRRIIRLHIAASPSKHVRENAETIEATVLETGRNAIDAQATPPAKAWLDDEKSRVRGVFVRQNVWKQTATLLAFEGGRPGASVLPAVDLRGSLFARIDSLEDPITLCAPPDALDPTPCLAPSDLKPAVPIVYVDDKGLLHFVEKVASKDAARLVYNTPNLPLPFTVHGREVVTIEWPIVFEKPDDVVFTSPAGQRSPDLQVTIEKRYSPRLFFEVVAPQGSLVGVVEPSDVASLVIATRGGPGTPGTPGSNGANGTNGSAGMSASCPGSPGGNGGPGGAGGNGGPGGPGGPGGDAGDIAVAVTCATGDCDAVAALASRIVMAPGGSGGPGGQGGRGGQGGQGGPGGSGTSCTDYSVKPPRTSYLSGGTTGPKGADGSPGASGPAGPPGADGKVAIRVSL
jgi:hypothetical protein